MIPVELESVANHLWQSTLFAAAAGALTLALRKNRAHIRYWVWFAASVKFLIPFSLLVDLGKQFQWQESFASGPPVLSYVVERTSQPFTSLSSVQTQAENSSADWIPGVLYLLWGIGSATIAFAWWRRWRGLREVLRTASSLDLPIGMKAMTSHAFAEPGVFGVRRPVLLLPAGITNCLTPSQMTAIVTHELCHVRRHDNLTSAIHMCVEILFWFHPLVWWLGARLMEEREHACDEEVLLSGTAPEEYAEGILKICELYLESPLPCVSGVTGANLKKRIEEIMSKRVGLRLNFIQRVALTAAGMVVMVTPILVGIVNAPAIQAQSSATATPKFEVVSVRPCKSEPNLRRGAGGSAPGTLNTGCDLLVDEHNLGLIQRAYVRFAGGHINPFDVLAVKGGPS